MKRKDDVFTKIGNVKVRVIHVPPTNTWVAMLGDVAMNGKTAEEAINRLKEKIK